MENNPERFTRRRDTHVDSLKRYHHPYPLEVDHWRVRSIFACLLVVLQRLDDVVGLLEDLRISIVSQQGLDA
jgi:hypothetical protein